MRGSDLIAALEGVKTPTVVAGERLDDAIEGFVAGVALNKWGRRYRARAVQDLESSLNRLPDWVNAGD